ncbi:DinB family protein [uncultured Kordia sp.]|uniref:DinB family protein n=1 Tax=uncultured Kordia sp. TaxID=507699 RepID=UPI002628131D|nr:DinB family protein [uncultured Kordia sp.]
MDETDKTKELVTYNLWANKRLLTWLKANENDLLTKECLSSFTSIIDTVNHILDGQIFYYYILKQQPIERAWGITTEEILKGFIEQSEMFLDYVNSHKSLNELRSLKTKTLEGNFTQFELIQHCINHSTFHRGQIITMGHQLGFSKAPSTDMLFFFIKRNKTRK